jgi:23S rRNA (uracil1939-C5)-methyltransferase
MTQSNVKNKVALDIDAVSFGPHGIGRHEGKVVMIPRTAPGDRVTAHLAESKERYSIGELADIVTPSPLRQTPPCPYVPECGGCSWQHIRYEAQLKAKEQNVVDALCRIGKLSDFELRPIIGSPQEYHYRRRIRLHYDGKRLGFFRSSSHDVVEIERCLIADATLNSVIELLRWWVPRLSSTLQYVEVLAGDEPQMGDQRSQVRDQKSEGTTEVVCSNQARIVLSVAGQFAVGDEARCEQFVAENPVVGGLIAHGRGWRRVWGQPWITIRLARELEITVDADVFTQVNPYGNREILTELVREGAFTKNDRVLELYCGAGNFTLAIARDAKTVTAVEGYRPAIANGKLNGQKLDLDHIEWVCAPVPVVLQQLRRRREKFSKIVLDPPRTGAKGLAHDLANLGASRILYVSCNPTTLARDLAALTKEGYKLTVVQPIDLFPHTFHVETIARLDRIE